MSYYDILYFSQKKSAPAVKQEADLFARDPSTTPDSIAFGSRMTGLRSG